MCTQELSPKRHHVGIGFERSLLYNEFSAIEGETAIQADKRFHQTSRGSAITTK